MLVEIKKGTDIGVSCYTNCSQRAADLVVRGDSGYAVPCDVIGETLGDMRLLLRTIPIVTRGA